MERELLSWLRRFAAPDPRVLLGIGDDAAVVKFRGDQGVVTTDMLLEGTHFLLSEATPEQIGHKALGANLSDLAAMASVPLAAFISIAARKDQIEIVQRIYSGFLPLAEAHSVCLAGGDTNVWTGPLVINVALLGSVTERGILARSGARPGDRLLLTGEVGGSLAGRHLAVEPRVKEALLLHERYQLHAAMDVSDGLALDASRLADASGCGLVLDMDRIPVTQAARLAARTSGRSALEHALSDGEDFELILAAPEAAANQMLADQPLDIPLTAIGTFIPEPGLWHGDRASGLQPLPPSGYWHG